MAQPNWIAILLIVIGLLVVYPPRDWLGFRSPNPVKETREDVKTNVVSEEMPPLRERPPPVAPLARKDGADDELQMPTPRKAQPRKAPRAPKQAATSPVDETQTPLMHILQGKNYTPKIHDYGWVFKRYIPSKLEEEFYEAVGPIERTNWVPAMINRFRPQFEKLMRDMERRVIPNDPITDFKKYRHECDTYVQNTVEGLPASSNDGTCLSFSEPMDPEIFSRFEYVFQCIDEPCDVPPPAHPKVGDTHVSYIEPLAGIMRHPQVFITNNPHPYLLHKGYMIPDKWALHNLHLRYKQPTKFSHYYDCGASTYADGSGGPSQNWFIGLGDCLCTPYDTMRLWEMQQHQPHAFWAGVPERLHPNYMWYNYPLSANTDSFANPLNHLISKVNFGDPVIMKIDFDTPVLELKLIQTLLATPDAYRRVDEFFFEHHVNLPIMAPIWGGVDQACYIRCTIDLFKALRNVGIRAHSWV